MYSVVITRIHVPIGVSYWELLLIIMALHVNRAIGEKTYWLITFGQRRTFFINVGSILDTNRTSHYIPVARDCCAIVYRLKVLRVGSLGLS